MNDLSSAKNAEAAAFPDESGDAIRIRNHLIDLFEAGTVLDPVPSGPDALDRAVVRLLRG